MIDNIDKLLMALATLCFSGDGGAAVQAQINGPLGVAVTPAGDILFSDGKNHVIRKITADGRIQVIAVLHLTTRSTRKWQCWWYGYLAWLLAMPSRLLLVGLANTLTLLYLMQTVAGTPGSYGSADNADATQGLLAQEWDGYSLAYAPWGDIIFNDG